MRKLPHRFALRLALLGVLALLVAQMGALSHAYAHDAAAGKSTSQPLGATGHNPCGECLAFAPLLAAAAASGAQPGVAPAPHATPQSAPAPAWVGADPHLAFRSRAPPSTP